MMKKRTKILLVSAFVMAVSVTISVLWADENVPVIGEITLDECAKHTFTTCEPQDNGFCYYFLRSTGKGCGYDDAVNIEFKDAIDPGLTPSL